MKKIFVLILMFLPVWAADSLPPVDGAVMRSAKKSLLKRVDFQKTDSDLAFLDKVQMSAESYEPYYTEYDASGRCIKNCVYAGITLAEERELRRRATNLFARDLCMLDGGSQSDCDEQCCTDLGCDVSEYAESIQNNSDANGGGARVAIVPRSAVVSRAAGIPLSDIYSKNMAETLFELARFNYERFGVHVVSKRIFDPVLKNTLVVTSASGFRGVAKGSKYHPGIDLKATTGTSVYAPYGGIVNKANGHTLELFHYLGLNRDPMGGVVPLPKGGDEYSYFTRYHHLSRIDERRIGHRVERGQQIGAAGTGGGFAAHLHYEFGVYLRKSKIYVNIDLLGLSTDWRIENEYAQQRQNAGYGGYSARYAQNASVFMEYNMLGAPYYVQYSYVAPANSVSNVFFQECVALAGENRYRGVQADKQSLAVCTAANFVGCVGIYDVDSSKYINVYDF